MNFSDGGRDAREGGDVGELAAANTSARSRASSFARHPWPGGNHLFCVRAKISARVWARVRIGARGLELGVGLGARIRLTAYYHIY